MRKCQPASPVLEGAMFAKGVCGEMFATGVSIRGLRVTPQGEIVGIDHSSYNLNKKGEQGNVLLFQDLDRDGVADSFKTLASNVDLSHGVGVHGGYVYAATDTSVLRCVFGTTPSVPFVFFF